MTDFVSFQCKKIGCEYHPLTYNGLGFSMRAADVLKINEYVKCPNCQGIMRCRESEELLEDIINESEWKAKQAQKWDDFEKYLRGDIGEN